MSDKNKADIEKSTVTVCGQPETAEELIHKYGTYEIQPTADSDNKYPEIAQGYPKSQVSDRRARSEASFSKNTKKP